MPRDERDEKHEEACARHPRPVSFHGFDSKHLSKNDEKTPQGAAASKYLANNVLLRQVETAL
jgi:hypothetical protein